MLLVICDLYLWEIGKKVVGIQATRIGFLIYIMNRNLNDIIIRCFSNSIEAIFQIIAFYYYLRIKAKFDSNTVIMTALITLSFMIRNTSPVGWIPLLFLKIIYEKTFLSFLIAGIFVAIPLIFLCVCLDSLYYGELTITSYNFVRANLVEGLSKYYGVDPPH